MLKRKNFIRNVSGNGGFLTKSELFSEKFDLGTFKVSSAKYTTDRVVLTRHTLDQAGTKAATDC